MDSQAALTGIALLIFCLLHSITASLVFKNRVKSLLGDTSFEVWFRVLYNLVSFISFLPVVFFVSKPSPLLWQVSGPIPGIFYTVRAASLIGMAVALLQIDWLGFAGIRQLFASYQLNPRKPERLVTSGIYKMVRHPLYFFSLVFIWFAPAMSESWFIFSVVATLYFFIGSYLEELKMVRQFGAVYRDYQMKVPRIIPFFRIRSKR